VGSYRVVLANEPRLLRGLLSRVLQHASGIQVAGEEMDDGALSSLVEERKADWVIVSLWQDGDLPAFLQDLAAKHPSLCFLGMAADGSQARTWCSEKGEQSLCDPTLDELLATLLHQSSYLAEMRIATSHG
jgi:hypothetical protein